ncbi:MAG: hypothetical protein E7004_00535 [Alphaproteobacteria bacterium]|nr:hypothetical protein [Alphaproteobacteria bacterium]
MVGKITPNYIEVRQGDNFSILLQFKDEDKFIDISGSVLKMFVKNKADGKTVLIKQGIIDDGERGKSHISILPEDTKKLNVKDEFITDIQITFANGETHTIYPQSIGQVAAFIVTQHVTE